MKKVSEVSRLTGVSVRTLRYYDSIGLLCPSEKTEAGYRLYSDSDLEKLSQILLYRQLAFSLADIDRILKSPSYDRERAIEQQIELLEMKKRHIEGLIKFARQMKEKGADEVSYKALDRSKLDEYEKRAKEQWGDTDAYREYEQRGSVSAADGLMALFADFGKLKGCGPASREAQEKVRELQDYITANFYTCTDKILSSLGQMYAADGEFKENIDSTGGEGTALFASKAIEVYCTK